MEYLHWIDSGDERWRPALLNSRLRLIVLFFWFAQERNWKFDFSKNHASDPIIKSNFYELFRLNWWFAGTFSLDLFKAICTNLHNHKHKTITSCILGRKRSRTANVHPIKNGRKWSETKDHQVINIRQTFEDLELTHAHALACITDNNKYRVLSIRVKLLLAYLSILISSRKH